MDASSLISVARTPVVGMLIMECCKRFFPGLQHSDLDSVSSIAGVKSNYATCFGRKSPVFMRV